MSKFFIFFFCRPWLINVVKSNRSSYMSFFMFILKGSRKSKIIVDEGEEEWEECIEEKEEE